MVSRNVKDFSYLIIGGTTKAGTTSFYNYLVAHPEVSGSFRKETNFFLDKEWEENPSIYRYEDGIEKYGANYHYSSIRKLYIEASPEYLYSPGTPIKIFNSLPKAKILFILRNPFSRLISWYKFAKQIGIISPNVTFDDFISQQNQNIGSIKPNILEQGLYSKYLARYFEIFNSNRVKVIFFEDLAGNPLEVIKDICKFCEIVPEFYNNFQFKVFNRTERMRFVKVHEIYIAIRENLSLKMPRLYIRSKKIWDYLKPLYIRLISIKDHEPIISKHTRQNIFDYYSHEISKLEFLLKKPVPWMMEKRIEKW
jgi:hypothetical protein